MSVMTSPITLIALDASGGLIIPNRGCRTLRRACRCGWQDGEGHRSARGRPGRERGRASCAGSVRTLYRNFFFWCLGFEIHKPNDGMPSPHVEPRPKNPAIPTHSSLALGKLHDIIAAANFERARSVDSDLYF